MLGAHPDLPMGLAVLVNHLDGSHLKVIRTICTSGWIRVSSWLLPRTKYLLDEVNAMVSWSLGPSEHLYNVLFCGLIFTLRALLVWFEELRLVKVA